MKLQGVTGLFLLILFFYSYPFIVLNIMNASSRGQSGSYNAESHPISFGRDAKLQPGLQNEQVLELKLNKSGPNYASSTERIIYKLTYMNIGNVMASGVVLTETLPAYTFFSHSDSTPGWKQSGNTNIYTFDVGSLSPTMSGDQSIPSFGSVEFVVRLDRKLPGNMSQITNTARIGDDQRHGLDAIPGDNISTATTRIFHSNNIGMLYYISGKNFAGYPFNWWFSLATMIIVTLASWKNRKSRVYGWVNSSLLSAGSFGLVLLYFAILYFNTAGSNFYHDIEYTLTILILLGIPTIVYAIIIGLINYFGLVKWIGMEKKDYLSGILGIFLLCVSFLAYFLGFTFLIIEVGMGATG
jgi:uncharacterized repeat protein (TIGR01451 family)